jgi:hypothetical protein
VFGSAPEIRQNPHMDVELSEDEKRLLSEGLNQWGGPAKLTDQFAVAMGFQGVSDFYAQAERIVAVIESAEPLSALDATRALAATEIVFASDIFGAGAEWATVTGLTDDETIRVLRRLQRKLVSPYRALLDP